MRAQVVLGFIFWLVIALPGLAASNPEKLAPDIRSVMTAQATAWNRGDIDGFMNGYARSPKIVFISGDSITRGWETVRNRYRKKYATGEQMGRLAYSDFEITMLCRDAAIVVGRWELKRKKDHPHGRFTLLFRRTPDGWRIMHDHTS
jgi:ketosteroid isomerase-like protein